MNLCTCEDERKEAERLLNALRHARRALAHELNVLADLEIELMSLERRWLNRGCAAAAIVLHSILIALLCWAIYERICRLEDLISEQELIVEDRRALYERAKQEYDIAKERYMACKNSLKLCAGCGEEVKPECIKTCRGCGRDYCNKCFDAGIEAWEMKQKEK